LPKIPEAGPPASGKTQEVLPLRLLSAGQEIRKNPTGVFADFKNLLLFFVFCQVLFIEF
jgi:hypothetical protein